MKSKNLKIKENHGVKYIEYPFFEKLNFVRAISSTRHGGVSSGENNSSMNLGFNTEDKKENIEKNFKIFCEATGICEDSLVASSQFHNANIRVCTKDDGGKGITKPGEFEDVDALVTNVKNLPLAVFSADCVPIFFADKNSKSIGAAHCGWRGTYKNLAAKTAEKLITEYGAKKEDMFVIIGVSIKKCCYEVSEELYRDFIKEYPFVNDKISTVEKNGRFYLDLPLINKNILMKFGIKEENIFIADLCTCCYKNDLFSHRGQGKGRGIMANIIELV